MSDKSQGLYHKFNVSRVDGQSTLGQKHFGCSYFVLDLTHDPHARKAILAYIEACKDDHPLLAQDLRDKLCHDPV